jgi:hypothetical protein
MIETMESGEGNHFGLLVDGTNRTTKDTKAGP